METSFKKPVDFLNESGVLNGKFDKLPVPKTTGMIEEYERKRKRQVSGMRAILDYGIGVLILVAGIFLFFRAELAIDFNSVYPPDVWDRVFGFVCVSYGGWRIYRGYKKNYFKS